MHAVVSLLDQRCYRKVEDLWAELDRKFSVRGIYVTPLPHFSYQVAERYDVEALKAALQSVALNMAPFQIRTGGLGIFTGSNPVLFVQVVRAPELSELHQRLWQGLSETACGLLGNYSPERWLPHITLAHADIDKSNLPEVVRLLSERDFDWEIQVNNLSFLYHTGSGQEVRSRFEFGRPASPVRAFT
jgi:2'-5' RNA ligase